MSLRARLNLLITLLFILCMFGAGAYVVNNAREGIIQRIETAAHLTMQLIEATMITDKTGSETEQRLLVQLAGLEITEHLKIFISHEQTGIPQDTVNYHSGSTGDVPRWFVRLVKPDTTEFRRVISRPGLPYTSIVVWSDPINEITEAWRDTRDALYFLITFILSINMLVYFTLGRGLAPLENIQKGLEGIERGDYNLRLPEFGLPELNRISEKFNHMADVLKRSRERNRDLAQRSLSIQEEERRNLARELHDELGQTVSAIKAMGMSISDRTQTRDRIIYDCASAIVTYADRMYDVTRSMMQRLRPAVLDELGLVPALQEMVDAWNQRHEDIFCYFECGTDNYQPDEGTAINLYRIIQESLTNIARHSRADEVRINLLRRENMLLLSIHDNGVGFNPAENHTKGIGLAGIKERVEAMGGNFEMVTAEGQGVSILISIPLNTDS